MFPLGIPYCCFIERYINNNRLSLIARLIRLGVHKVFAGTRVELQKRDDEMIHERERDTEIFFSRQIAHRGWRGLIAIVEVTLHDGGFRSILCSECAHRS